MVLKKMDSVLIDRYLDGDLNGSELEKFKKKLESSDELRKELKLQQEINAALGERDVIDLREKLKIIHRGSLSKKRNPHRRYILSSKPAQIAASAAIIFVIIFFGIRQMESANVNERLFDKYYEKYEPINIRSGAEEIDNTYLKAMTAYLNEDYEIALMYFEEVLQLDKNRLEADMLKGASNMELEEYKQAEKSFVNVIDHKDNLFIEDAEWCLGFCYLKTNNEEKAIEQFSIIASKNSPKKETAKKILKKIH